MISRASLRESELIQIIENVYPDDDEKTDEKSIHPPQAECIDSHVIFPITEIIEINSAIQDLINKINHFQKRFFRCYNFFIPCRYQKFKLEWRRIELDLSNRLEEIHSRFREALRNFKLEHSRSLIEDYSYRLKQPNYPELEAAITEYRKLGRLLSDEREQCSRLFIDSPRR